MTLLGPRELVVPGAGSTGSCPNFSIEGDEWFRERDTARGAARTSSPRLRPTPTEEHV